MALASARMRTPLLVTALSFSWGSPALPQAVTGWAIHSTTRPQPPVVDPGGFVASARPSDAIALFDGGSLAGWHAAGEPSRPAAWKVSGGVLEIVPGSGAIETARRFGDVQLHIEWASPVPPSGTGQNRGNSGVFLMGAYEVQVLDSYRNTTYPDGQAGAIYGQYPPLVNASRPPGEWQSFDIVFRAPQFDQGGRLLAPARMTVLHNGVLIHDDVALTGPTNHEARPPYEHHPDRLPLSLQDHGAPVRFRNIWVRELVPANR